MNGLLRELKGKAKSAFRAAQDHAATKKLTALTNTELYRNFTNASLGLKAGVLVAAPGLLYASAATPEIQQYSLYGGLALAAGTAIDIALVAAGKKFRWKAAAAGMAAGIAAPLTLYTPEENFDEIAFRAENDLCRPCVTSKPETENYAPLYILRQQRENCGGQKKSLSPELTPPGAF